MACRHVLKDGHWIWRIWIWRIDRRSLGAIPAALVGLAFLVAGTYYFSLGQGIIAGVVTFVTTYGTFRIMWFSADAAEDFLLYIGPYLAAIARRGAGFLVTYTIVVWGYLALFGWLYGNDPTSFSDTP